MFDRYNAGEQALLVHIFFSQDKDMEDLQEFESLVSSAGVAALRVVTGSRKAPHPKYFVGEGKAKEIAEVVKTSGASVVLFDHALSPAQEHNLERLCECRVIDRTGLILDIFAQRACTYEGKLQVELAKLRHLATRLVRGWTHLERQKGGIGLRGPGETQLEIDRRLLRNRISQILSHLERVEKQREQSRRARTRANVPTISLVGYTNAGKSTLFNLMTEAEVYVADRLFATLDPTLRRINVGDVGDTVLADTVGFIRHLPHDLVAAFKATLKETQRAALLLHIVDAADTRINENIDAVDQVLAEIEANDIPTLLVMNKIDLLDDFAPRIDRDEENRPVRVWLSAHSGEGVTLLMQALTERLTCEIARHELRLPPQAGRLLSRFYQLHAIEKEWVEEDGSIGLVVRLPIIDWHRLCKQEMTLADYLLSDCPLGTQT
ncbi:MAG: GTPase HflX [Sodalis sp.]|uniref:ribosome rescue GTPase HflX n=1 Tax=Sodalis sp. (in: enterobacteria) TaxID=1898979 RepID=UPI003872D905|nr:MAG: GTPase HflX [Sodalis sp.]